MKKILAIITFLLFLILLWYTKTTYQECCENNKETVIKKPLKKTTKTIKETPLTEPLIYNWNNSEAITNKLWDTEKNKILSNKSDAKILQIVAPYFKDESESIGIARAKSAFSKLNIKIDSNKIEYKSKLITFYEGAKTKPFSGTEFNWLIRNENIVQVKDKTIIYFPSNSTKKVQNTNIAKYLNDVAKNIKGTSKKIILSGHSDSRGNAAINKKLALNRANSIKRELILLGVNKNNITVISFGEEKPIADNSTKAGQQKNRRVELEIK